MEAIDEYVTRQTRIFIPPNAPYNLDENWAETVFGRIIKETVKDADYLKWFWFSRYGQKKDGDIGDCDFGEIPKSFERHDGLYYSIRFRFAILKSKQESFETNMGHLISTEGCKITDFRPWKLVDDLGNDYHIGGNRSDERRKMRAEINVNLYYQICKLTLHCLEIADGEGRYKFEVNENYHNQSSFNKPHHLFVNITDIPLFNEIFLTNKDVHPPYTYKINSARGFYYVNNIDCNFTVKCDF